MRIDTSSKVGGYHFNGSTVSANHSNQVNVTPFTREQVVDAIKSSNFNKGLDPDCFDGNVLNINTQLK